MNRSWNLKMECEEVARLLAIALGGRGFSVSRSFDLQSARDSLKDLHACHCPNHGTIHCDCQYIVLQVRSNQAEPISIIVHGHDQGSILSMSHPFASEFERNVEELICANFNMLPYHPVQRE